MRRAVAPLAALCLLLAAPARAQPEAAADPGAGGTLSDPPIAPNEGRSSGISKEISNRSSIGVAPFESVGGSGAPPAPPDVAARLAEALEARGVERVVGPDALGVPASAEPSQDAVRRWAADAAVAGIAVGRVTRLGRRLSITVRLRDGASGDLVGTWVADAERIELLPPGIDELADQLAGASRELQAAAGPSVAAPPPASVGEDAAEVGEDAASVGEDAAEVGEDAAEVGEDAAEASRRGPLGLGLGLDGGSGGEPIDISASETEFVLDEGRTIFRGDVRVRQGDVTLTCDRLEAVLDSDTQQPRDITCTGSVAIRQLDKLVTCERATYSSEAQRVLCRENARARIGRHRAAGDEIEFRLDTSRVFVRSRDGRARVRLSGEEGSEREGSE